MIILGKLYLMEVHFMESKTPIPTLTSLTSYAKFLGTYYYTQCVYM